METTTKPVMGSVGDAYENVMCGSLLVTLERGFLQRKKFQTKAKARIKIFNSIEGSYNSTH